MDKKIKLFIIAQVAIISLFTVLALGCTPDEVQSFSDGYRYGYELNSSIEDSNNDTIMIVDDLASAEDVKF